MDNFCNGDENLEISQMDSAQQLNYLKTISTGRDPKSGKFAKGRSGNPKGRPRLKTNLDDCMNMVFAQKTNITVDGKTISTTMLQATCYKLLMHALANDDIKLLLQILKTFGSKVNLNELLPKPKAINYALDPSVQMIRNAIYDRLDRESGTYRGPDNDDPSDS